jgi:hypothetical protein
MQPQQAWRAWSRVLWGSCESRSKSACSQTNTELAHAEPNSQQPNNSYCILQCKLTTTKQQLLHPTMQAHNNQTTATASYNARTHICKQPNTSTVWAWICCYAIDTPELWKRTDEALRAWLVAVSRQHGRASQARGSLAVHRVSLAPQMRRFWSHLQSLARAPFLHRETQALMHMRQTKQAAK